MQVMKLLLDLMESNIAFILDFYKALKDLGQLYIIKEYNVDIKHY